MTRNTPYITIPEGLPDMVALGAPQRLCEVCEPGYYFAPETSLLELRIARFDGKAWQVVGVADRVSSALLMADVVYGPLEFKPAAPVEDVWPTPGDEFDVFVEVRDTGTSLDGFIQNPQPQLAQMLEDYGSVDFVMVEELFGQDFLPDSPGLYRMRLRMYVDPAYKIDDHEWSNEEPGLEVLRTERLTPEQIQVPA